MENATRLLEDLTADQKRAVMHKEGPLLVVAGAGSGKTRVVARRVAYLIATGIEPRSILAVTFTNKAAQEMAGRVQALTGQSGAHISTFHSFAARVLRQYGPQLGYPSTYSIFDTDDQASMIKRLMKESGLNASGVTPGDVREVISRWKNKYAALDRLELPRDNPLQEAAFTILPLYSEALLRAGAMDFDDLLLNLLELLENSQAARQALQERFHYVLIDEYQDTNSVQYAIAKTLSGARRNLMATGDPDQSIYSWRGAAIENILNFTRDFPGAIVVKLENNYRSRGPILAVASRLIQNNRRRIERALVAVREGGETVELYQAASEETEASQIASRIRQLASEGTPYRSMAVIYRVNWLSRVYERTFRAAGIPYRLIQGTEFFKRREVRDLVAYLRLLANPADDVSGGRIINVPPRGIAAKAQNRIAQIRAAKGLDFMSTVRAAAAQAPGATKERKSLEAFVKLMDDITLHKESGVAALLREILSKSGIVEYYAGMEDGPERVENMEELLNAAAAYEGKAPAEASVTGFLEGISLASDSDALDPNADAVALLTFHAAKGLEFEAVFMVAMEDGIMPHASNIEDPDALEEERRLSYVGITRARDRLLLSTAVSRFIHGKRSRQFPSRFLREIPSELLSVSSDLRALRPRNGWKEEAREEFPDETEESPRKSSGGSLKVGDVILHSHFGVGTVRQIIGAGIRTKATVDFETEGRMQIVLAFAQIQKLRDGRQGGATPRPPSGED